MLTDEYRVARSLVRKMYFFDEADMKEVVKWPFNFKGLSWNDRQELIGEMRGEALHFQPTHKTVGRRLVFEISQHNLRVSDESRRIHKPHLDKFTVDQLLQRLEKVQDTRQITLEGNRYH